MLLSRCRNFIRILPTQTRYLSTAKKKADVTSKEVPEKESDEIFNVNNTLPRHPPRAFKELTVEMFESIHRGNPEMKERIEEILIDYEYAKYNELGRVPTDIKIEDMYRLISECSSTDQRILLFKFFFKREQLKISLQAKKAKEKVETARRRQEKTEKFAERDAPRTGLLDANGEIIYGLWHNSLFCRIPPNQFKNGLSSSRLRTAAQFGRKLIFDFSYESYMRPAQINNAAEQMLEAYGRNRFGTDEPFDMWFCNLEEDSQIYQFFIRKALRNLHTGSMITTKQDCFTNYFDKDQLVYLSPHARETLENDIHKSDDIYIIGAFNDKGNAQPVSLRKAQKLGIRTKSLPLDRFVTFVGSKSLCMNHVTGILNDVLKNRGDWYTALKANIPDRKLKSSEQLRLEEKIRMEKMKKIGQMRLYDLDMFRTRHN